MLPTCEGQRHCRNGFIIISILYTVMDVLREVFGLVGGGQVGGENPLAHTGFTEGVVAFVLAIQVQYWRPYHQENSHIPLL